MAGADRRVSRRGALLTAAGVAASGVPAAAVPLAAADWQPGIVSVPPPHVCLAAFDVLTRDRVEVAGLLQAWTARIAALPRVAVTLGVGAGLLSAPWLRLPAGDVDRMVLPAFRGDALDGRSGGGDLLLQVGARTPDDAHAGVRSLAAVARPLAQLRWLQPGFRAEDGTADPRGMFGFRDGTANLDPADPDQVRTHLRVDAPGSWLHGGTYLVYRRIRLLLETWDRTAVDVQERLVGRTRAANRRLPGAAASHAGLASPGRNGGVRILRRPYSYLAGVDPNGLQDAGLLFLAFVRDPARQFVPLQRRLAASDGLGAFSQHVASAVFACPPPAAAGGFLGDGLFR